MPALSPSKSYCFMSLPHPISSRYACRTSQVWAAEGRWERRSTTPGEACFIQNAVSPEIPFLQPSSCVACSGVCLFFYILMNSQHGSCGVLLPCFSSPLPAHSGFLNALLRTSSLLQEDAQPPFIVSCRPA